MLPGMIELRALTSDDWKAWRALRLAALAEAPDAFGSTLAGWQNAPEERWRDRLSIPGALDLIALHDGDPAGMATGIPDGNGSVEVISVWVDPAARGAGVGDALLAEIARWATGSGAAVVRLAVRRDNGPAIRLYERAGFVHAGQSPDDPSEILMTRAVG